jgi:hypothetical protein
MLIHPVLRYPGPMSNAERQRQFRARHPGYNSRYSHRGGNRRATVHPAATPSGPAAPLVVPVPIATPATPAAPASGAPWALLTFPFLNPNAAPPAPRLLPLRPAA